ncbi:OmpA family protein [Parabacteroides sp. 52]|uniref:OmpA family protein n=1 Tax=unclassified Parabacteroides TaxID=2649774 RepID=UPI0013D36685|nr:MULTISPECIES: OmpA family protein [unclassified Parabacteroides]MDH6533567.1 OOP family OmpA-OmpF porin [Parabacteroides sp. PM5-20]NDV54319.1 OmpA family protein [Parabacteroides sp. 52]
MKTKVLLFALLSGFVFSVSAQEYKPQVGFSNEAGYKTNFKKNKAGDNWFISIAGGGSILMGDHNSDADFGDRLNFAPSLSIGKWYSPTIGFRVQFNGGPIKSFGTNEDAQFKLDGTYLAAHADVLWDVTNLWAPYRESKVFRLIPWVGLGYAQRFESQGVTRSESPTLNGGILTAFRLSKRVDLNVEAQASLMNETFNRVAYKKLTDAMLQATVGLTFKLGKTDFEVLEPMDYALLNDLNGQINALRAANDELSKRPVSCPECPEPKATVVNNNTIDNVVYFRLNSAVIDKNQQINIYNTSEFAKENNTPIKVIGYADKNTGTGTYNMGLSEKRAKAVAKQLVEKYGISSNQITIEWRGSDEQPYSENNWNRVVIMRAND